MIKLKPNIGKASQTIRYILGIICLIITIVYLNELPFWAIFTLTILGIFLIVEALLKWCIIRATLGLINKEEDTGKVNC